jgi:nucleotide-binding universal stress UspA family protein
MDKIERILCPIDLSAVSAGAYTYAQSLASHCGASLIAQHVVELWQHPCAFYAASAKAFDEFLEQLLSAGRESLKQFLGEHQAKGLSVECIVKEGAAADAILSVAKTDAIDLIVMGTHGRRGLDRVLLGSVAERVLRNAPCPVLVVRNIQCAGHDAVRCRRILSCVDFSKDSWQVLEQVRSLAKAYGAELTALNVMDEVKNPNKIAREAEKAIAKLERLIAVAALDSITTHVAVRLGNAHEQILEFASEAGSDLIVTGIGGRHALGFGAFGSTAHRVIQHSSCPVLAVHLEERPRPYLMQEDKIQINELSIRSRLGDRSTGGIHTLQSRAGAHQLSAQPSD